MNGLSRGFSNFKSKSKLQQTSQISIYIKLTSHITPTHYGVRYRRATALAIASSRRRFQAQKAKVQRLQMEREATRR